MLNGKATKKSILVAAILAALALGCGGTVLAASLIPEDPKLVEVSEPGSPEAGEAASEIRLIPEENPENASAEDPKLVEAESEPEKVPDNGGFGDPKLVEAPASDSPDSVQAASEQEKVPDNGGFGDPKLVEVSAIG